MSKVIRRRRQRLSMASSLARRISSSACSQSSVLRAGLIVSLDVEFVGSAPDSFFELKRFARGFFCASLVAGMKCTFRLEQATASQSRALGGSCDRRESDSACYNKQADRAEFHRISLLPREYRKIGSAVQGGMVRYAPGRLRRLQLNTCFSARRKVATGTEANRSHK